MFDFRRIVSGSVLDAVLEIRLIGLPNLSATGVYSVVSAEGVAGLAATTILILFSLGSCTDAQTVTCTNPRSLL